MSCICSMFPKAKQGKEHNTRIVAGRIGCNVEVDWLYVVRGGKNQRRERTEFAAGHRRKQNLRKKEKTWSTGSNAVGGNRTPAPRDSLVARPGAVHNYVKLDVQFDLNRGLQEQCSVEFEVDDAGAHQAWIYRQGIQCSMFRKAREKSGKRTHGIYCRAQAQAERKKEKVWLTGGMPSEGTEPPAPLECFDEDYELGGDGHHGPRQLAGTVLK
ncbi:hypothetical protein B0H14DRAFT_2624673 [Mycena olivaceomarginata]|nr:hypothetical protein B0H14DRAFT_2624673 [Mycena olivaceomarginata]